MKLSTGKSFSEALILASTNPKYDKRLFIELRVQYMKTTSSEYVVYINCFELSIQKQKTICVHHMFWERSELAIFMYWTGNSMNNLLSYCRLVDAKIRASDKDLPVAVLQVVAMLTSGLSLPVTDCWQIFVKLKGDKSRSNCSFSCLAYLITLCYESYLVVCCRDWKTTYKLFQVT